MFCVFSHVLRASLIVAAGHSNKSKHPAGLVVGTGECSYASRRFQPDIMAFRFRLFRDYVAGVQRYWTQSGDQPVHLSLLPSTESTFLRVI